MEGVPNLKDFRSVAQYVTNGGKACELETIIDEGSKSYNPPHYDSQVFSDNQRFVDNHCKLEFLQNICYKIPKIFYFFRPETATQLAAKFAIKKLSGSKDLGYINHLLIQNPGIYDNVIPIYKIAQNVYRSGGLRPINAPPDLHRSIVAALVEIMNLNRGERFRGPMVSSEFLKDIGCKIATNHNKSFDGKTEGPFDFNMSSMHYLCFECDELVLDAKQLRTHIKEHPVYKCRTCELEFKVYQDKVNHVLTFCREPYNRGNCQYCKLHTSACTCIKNMKETIKQVEKFLSEQNDEIQKYVFDSDFFTAWLNSFDIHLDEKNLNRENFTNPSVKGPIQEGIFPDFEFDGNHLVIENYGYRALLSSIKEDLQPMCGTFSEAQDHITTYMNEVRGKCPYKPCKEDFDLHHLNERHFLCPIGAEINNEKIGVYNGMDFLHHNIEHYKEYLPLEEIKCYLCNFQCRGEGSLLNYGFHFDDKHLSEFRNKKCIVESADCGSLHFENMSSYIAHAFAFHINDEQTLAHVLPMLIKDIGVELVEIEKEEDNEGNKTTSEDKVNPIKEDNSKVIKNTMKETDPASPGDSSNDNNNKTFEGISFPDRKDTKAKKNFLKGPKKDDGDEDTRKTKDIKRDPESEEDFICFNEEHDIPRPTFKTSELLDLHVLTRHRCQYPKCMYSCMYSKDMLAHFKSMHQKDLKQCSICAANITDQEEHNKVSHKRCPSCQTWFENQSALQAHMTSCQVAKPGEKRKEDYEIVALGKPNTSLNLDFSDTDAMLNTCLLEMLEASGLSEDQKEKNRKTINKYTSEVLLTKNRLRNNDLGFSRSQNLLFEVPSFSSEQGMGNNISKAASLLGGVKQHEIFEASPNESVKQCINNFEQIEIICRKIYTVVTLCMLTEKQSICFLSSYISQNVIDIIEGYSKRDLHELSYKSILTFIQKIFVPLNTDQLEKRIFAYRPEPQEDEFSFCSRVRRHLNIVAKRLNEDMRDSYVEDALNKILRLHLSPQITRIIESKESLYSKFTSAEILDTILYYQAQNVQMHDLEDQYDVFSLGFKRNPSSSLRSKPQKPNKPKKSQRNPNTFAIEAKGDPKVPNGQKNSPKELSLESKKKIEALGPAYKGSYQCFTCLGTDHTPSRCDKGYKRADTLCYKTIRGKRVAHGFHTQCRDREPGSNPRTPYNSKNNYNPRNNNSQPRQNRPNWGPK